MKRLVLVPIIALASGFSPALAQTDTSTGTATGPNDTPYPQPPSIPECEDECGNPVDAEQSASGEYSCPSGSTEVENDSCGLKLNFGLTTYTTSTNFLKHDQSLRIPPSKGYNPPCVGIPPFKRSLASEWGKQNKRPVCMMLRTTDPSTGTIKPNSFETYGHSKTDATGAGSWAGPYTERATPGTAYMKRDTATDRFQVLSDQFLVDAKSENSTTVIRYYPKESAGQRDAATGFHPVAPNAQTLKTVRISQPSAKVVSVVQDENFSSFTAPKTRGFRWSIDGNTSVLTRHTGDPSICYPYERDRLTKTDLGNGTLQRVRTVDRAVTTNFPAGFHPTPPPPGYQPDQQDPPGGYSTVSRTMEQYRDLGNGNLRIFKKVEGYQTPKEVTTEYTYTSNDGKWSVSSGGQSGPRYAGAVAPPPGYTGPLPGTVQAASATNDYLGSRIATLRRTDGYWEDYAYDFNPGTGTMLTRIWSCWKNSAPGDHATAKETIITLEENSRTVIEKIAGQLVSSEYEKLTVAADGTRTLREEKKSGANSTLVTETAYFPDNAAEPNNGRIKYVRHSDGTLTRYSYSIVPDFTSPGKNALKIIKEMGAADAAQFSPAATGPVPALTMGTRTETITNSFEKVIDTKSYDIASGLLLEQSVATAVDAVGRPTHIIHDGDVNDYEDFTFACCGVKTHRERDGTLTDYTKDAFGRPSTTVVTLGPKTTTTAYTYSTEDYGGQTLPKTTVTRSISAGSNSTGSLFVSETIQDSEGRILVSRSPDANGDEIPETTTYTHDAATRTDSTTGPDGITRTTTRYSDGQAHTGISTFNGTPITVLTSYDYTPHNLNGGGIKTTVTISGTGVPSYAQSSYSNLADSAFQTESPGYNGATLITEIAFDERGRAVGHSSTGTPLTFRILNFLGETTESWTDSNGDNQFNDTAVDGIKDSVAKTATDYVTEDQTICRRTRQWVRDDANSDNLVSSTFRSPNGIYQRSVPLAGVGPVTVTALAKPLNGNASATTTTDIGTGTLTRTNIATLNADGTTTTVATNKDTNGAVITSRSQVSDLQDRPTTMIGERGLTTSYSDFTAGGAPRKTVFSDDTYSVTTLDTAARPTKVETHKADGTLIATVNTTYHPDGSVAANWGTNTNPIYKLYDLQGRLKELRTYRSANLALAPDENTEGYDSTTWIYELATGLLTRKQYADGKGTDYTYTPDGKIRTRTWARSDMNGSRLTTTYDYTPSGQLSKTDYSDTTPDVTQSYDRIGRLTLQTNVISQSVLSYDPTTLALNTETICYDLDGQPGFEFTRALHRSWNARGLPTGFRLTDANLIENEASYGYHPNDGRLQTVNGDATVGTFAYDYQLDSLSLVHTVNGPAHLVINSWNPTRDILDAKNNQSGSTTISNYTYLTNSLDQIVSTTQIDFLSATPKETLWDYDHLGQIISANRSGVIFDRAYKYDAVGNRIEARDRATSPTGTPNYKTNTLDQYTTINDIAQPQNNYDFDGNLTNMSATESTTPNTSIEWDSENRIIESHSERGDPPIRFRYDSQSRRIEKAVGTTSTIYIYDGWNCIAEYATENNQLLFTKSYLWGIDITGTFQAGGGVGGMLAVKFHHPQPTSYYPIYDGNGNITEYIKNDGSAVVHFEYDPFGNIVSNWGASDMFSYGYSTKPLDHEVGLYYYGYRYYDPINGRWISRDPFGEDGGINLYAFIGNNTVNRWDVLGLEEQKRAEIQEKLKALCEEGKKDKDLKDLAQEWVEQRIDELSGNTGRDGVLNNLQRSAYAGQAYDELQSLLACCKNVPISPASEARIASENGKNLGVQLGAIWAGYRLASGKWPQPGEGKGWVKMRGDQGHKDAKGNTWKKDQLHKDHWDVSDEKGNKIREVDYDGNEIWPNGPKNKNK